MRLEAPSDDDREQEAAVRAHQDSMSMELLARADRRKVLRRQMWPVESAVALPVPPSPEGLFRNGFGKLRAAYVRTATTRT